jgi:hypothetical protein
LGLLMACNWFDTEAYLAQSQMEMFCLRQLTSAILFETSGNKLLAHC